MPEQAANDPFVLRVEISAEGDARIHQHVTLPANCLAPIVLVHPNGGTTRYISVTGWR